MDSLDKNYDNPIYLFHIGGQDCLQIRDVGLGVVEVVEELETVCETGEDGELAFERVLAEVQVEGSNVIDLARFPIGIGLGGSDMSDGINIVSGHEKTKKQKLQILILLLEIKVAVRNNKTVTIDVTIGKDEVSGNADDNFHDTPADHGNLVEVGEKGLDHGVLEAELGIPLLAVLGGA